MDRSQFTFYESFFEAISRIKKKADRADAYDAICAYALYGTEPDLESLASNAAVAFILSKPNLDASRRKAASGKKGGTKKQTGSKSEANDKQTESEKEKEKEGEKEIEIENECYTPKPPRFSPPTVEDVRAYCRERKNNIDPQRFVDYYQARGWKLGKESMKDWKAAVRTWERKEDGHGAAESGDSGTPAGTAKKWNVQSEKLD